MKTITGNLLDQTPGILCHQVNLQGVMGAGIALQIRHKWPSAFVDYTRHCRNIPNLGDVVFSTIERHEVIVAHLFGQAFTGRSSCQTVYSVYPEILKLVSEQAAFYNIPIYMPHGIGCGLAGGDWKIMAEILKAHLPEAIIVEWNGK